jgi:signal transduction histidine kinase/CheY-like chemotaxis protein
MHPHEHSVQLRQGPPWPRLACFIGIWRAGPSYGHGTQAHLIAGPRLLSRVRNSFKNSPINETDGGERIHGGFFLAFSAVAVGLAVQGIFAGEPAAVAASGAFGIALVISWSVGRLGHPMFSRSLLPTVGLIIATSVAWFGNGLHDMAVLSYPIIVTFSALLLGGGAAFVFALFGSAAATLLVWGDTRGFNDSPAASTSGYPDAAVVIIFLFFSAMLMRFVIRSLNRSIETLRASQAAVAESNRNLESRAVELRTSEARWRSLVENAPDRIMTVSSDGSIVFANFPMGDRPDRQQPSIYDLVEPEGKATLESAVRSVFSESAPSMCELRGADGERWLSVHLGPIDAGGETTGATLIVSDITESREADAARRHLEQQLNEAQKMEALGQLAGGIAHDFNNLLTVIGGNARLLEHDVSSESARESLGEIQASQDRAAVLVRQLLAFGRRQVMHPQVLDLREELSNIEGVLRRLVGEHVEFSFAAAEQAAPVLADPGQIEQVVVNLALNARDAMPSGGRLELRLWSHHSASATDVAGTVIPPGRFTVMSFADDGTGMDESTRLRIFQPFFTTKPSEKGTGLGLSSVYGIVSQSGGHIVVESQPMQGATFHVYLPETEDTREEVAEPALRATVGTGDETILVVEDSAPMRRLLKRMLESCGYLVHMAEDGSKALELAATCGPIDLVLTDLIMPGMDGKTFADQFEERYGRTAVIYMSGYADDHLDSHRFEGGSFNFIQKPFVQDDLFAMIREVLDLRGGG